MPESVMHVEYMQVILLKPSNSIFLLGIDVVVLNCRKFSFSQEFHGRRANGASKIYMQQPMCYMFQDWREILFDAKLFFLLPSIPYISLSPHAESTCYWLSMS